MKKHNAFTAYILIGLGIYFLIQQLDLQMFDKFYSWPTFLIIIGISFLIHSFSASEYEHIFTGVLLLGLGIHFHGLVNYDFWFDHWSIYALFVVFAFFVIFLLLGLFIHFHGLENYDFWFDHWSIYALIVGIAFLARFFKTKKGFVPGVILIGLSLLMIFSVTLPKGFDWLYGVQDFLA